MIVTLFGTPHDPRHGLQFSGDGMLSMTTFRVTPRGKKYWVEVAADDGTRSVEKGFTAEDAAVRYARDMQKVSDRAGLAHTTLTGSPSDGR